jgi:transposase
VRLLGISKRADPYLRTLLIHGARAVMTHSKAPSEGQRTWRSWRLRTRWHARSGRCRLTSASTNPGT